jgi:cytochrome c-type biogenesis protein
MWTTTNLAQCSSGKCASVVSAFSSSSDASRIQARKKQYISSSISSVPSFPLPYTTSLLRLMPLPAPEDLQATMTISTAAVSTSDLGSVLLLSRSITTLQDWLYHSQATASAWVTSVLNPGSAVTSTSSNSALSFLIVGPVMYLAGLFTSVSPCVWGLLPLTISYISQAAGERQDKGTIWPAIAFAMGIATVFCSAGMAAVQIGGVFGGSTNINNIFNPTDSSSDLTNLLLPFFSYAVCFAMGLQLLELFQFPSLDPWIQQFTTMFNKVTKNQGKRNDHSKDDAPLILVSANGQIMDSQAISNAASDADKSINSERGSLFRVFLLGGSSALVSSPCATPVLTSLLAFVAQTQSPLWYGATLLFVYTLGYSTPLLLVAATGGSLLVKLREGNFSDDGADGGDNRSNQRFPSFNYGLIAPWVSPITGGVLLWYGTTGLLTTFFGDPALAALGPVIE